LNHDTLQKIRKLVGPITAKQLQYVECAVDEHIGIFIPSLGQCGYAITPGHTHPGYSIMMSFEPDSPVTPKGIATKWDEYGFTVISPDIPHEEKPMESFTRYVAVMIEAATFERIWKSYSQDRCGPFFWAPFVIPQTVLIHIKEFFAEFETSYCQSNEVLQAIGTYIAHAFIRAMLKRNVSVEKISTRFEIQRAIEIMNAHYGEKISIPFLAEKVNRSETHFSRLFKQETGCSPNEYLIRIRIEKARKLLSQTRMNATEIALECGFSSTAHFSDTFKKNTGVSPVQYRKKFA